MAAYVSYEVSCGCGPARFGCVCCRIWKNFKRAVDVSNEPRWRRGWWKNEPEVTHRTDSQAQEIEAETEERDSQAKAEKAETMMKNSAEKRTLDPETSIASAAAGKPETQA